MVAAVVVVATTTTTTTATTTTTTTTTPAKAWHDYFPHVSAEELRANFHRRLNALQGRRRTFMVGELSE